VTRKSTSLNVVSLPPGAPSAAPERSALAAGLVFVDGVAAGWGLAHLHAWIQDHLVAPGRMRCPTSITEAVVGTIALDPNAEPLGSEPPPADGPSAVGASRLAPLEELPKLLAMARSRVVVVLRAFIAATPDDRFLKAAIYADRVQRVRSGDNNRSVWVARPSEKDLLSDIVLSLFAADVLMHREFHEKNLSVCDVCGRVSFQSEATLRTACIDHPAKSDSRSGFHLSSATFRLEPKK
jgi:hypothetical protein